MQPKSELDLQGAVGGLPVVAEEGGDAVEALDDGVDVDVQEVLGAGEVGTAVEVGAQGVHEVGAAAVVVVQDRSEGGENVAGEIRAVAEKLADEAEIGQGGTLAGAAEGEQRGDAASGLGVRQSQCRGSGG